MPTKLTGELVEKKNDVLIIMIEGENISIPLENIKKVKLAIRF